MRLRYGMIAVALLAFALGMLTSCGHSESNSAIVDSIGTRKDWLDRMPVRVHLIPSGRLVVVAITEVPASVLRRGDTIELSDYE